MLELIGRFYPFCSGNFSIVNSRRFRRLLPPVQRTAWCPSPGGKLLVSLSDEVGRCIYYTGDYDKKITRLCRRLLRPGDTAIDIGANVGVVTLAMAKYVGPSGRVHAFEPNPVLQAMLDQSIQRNAYAHCTLHTHGIARQRGELELAVPVDNSGQGSFKYDADGLAAHRFICEVTTLTDALRNHDLSKLRLIKIDVEGFEADVLLGAAPLLQVNRPDAILFESNEQNMAPFWDREAVRILASLGYDFWSIPKTLFFARVEPMNSSQPSHDIVAIPRERSAEVSSTINRW